MTSYLAVALMARLAGGPMRGGRANIRGPVHTPYATHSALAIRSIELPPSPQEYQLEEIKLQIGATYDNPFDPKDVSLDCVFILPSGRVLHVPGFLYRSFTRSLIQGVENVQQDGEPDWRIRFCPTEVGKYTVTLSLKDRSGQVESSPQSFTATKSDDPGFIRVSPRDPRYFEFDDGKPYFPIGANVCWGNAPGTFSYDQWFPQYGKVGANYGRLWLSPGFTTFALEQTGKTSDGKGMGQFDLGNAWRLDEVMRLARANDLYLMLTIESYNILRDRDGAPFWEQSPQNRDNGGPLRIWSDFWTDPEMDALFKAKLRYIVARWGWDPHVFAWEFWNEVDNVRDYDPAVVREWHIRMAAYLKEIDPYEHLRTTSFSDAMGNRDIDQLSDLDYVQTHLYGSPDLAASVSYSQTRKAEYGKPHYVGEVGADATGPRADIDKTGQQVHDPMWASLGSGSSGGSMSWWWDSLIEPNHLYPLYRAFSEFVRGIDFPAEGFRQTDVHVSYVQNPSPMPRRDLVLENGPVSWDKSPANQPRTVLVTDRDCSGELPLAGIMHGLTNHPDLHNPVRFRFRTHRALHLDVEVGDVSGYGGAMLRVTMDGDVVLTRTFAVPDTATHDTIHRFAGNYSVEIPPGEHTVIVENIGADWFMVGYRIRKFYVRTGPPVSATAITGEKTAFVWLRNESDTWRNVVQRKQTISPTPACTVGLAGLASGRWRAVVWDTWKGVEIATTDVAVGIDGKVKVTVPGFDLDVAVRLTKQD